MCALNAKLTINSVKRMQKERIVITLYSQFCCEIHEKIDFNLNKKNLEKIGLFK